VQQLLGHVAMIEGDADAACVRFGRARLLAPEDGAILDDLAAAQMAAGRFSQAETNLGHLLRDPDGRDRGDLLHMRAECLLSLDRPVDAREVYRALTSGEGQSDARAWVGLARSAFQLGDERGCLRAASRVISIDRKMPDGYMLMAAVHRNRREDAEALEKLDAGLMRAGPDPDLLAMRSLVLSELGRRGEALTAAQAALDINPAHESAQRMLNRLAVVSVPVD
jgi:tetratricopeptide (TPR) repeat protein